MKKSYLRAGLALACALGLSACGGGSHGQLYLGGKAFGVTKTGLVLQNNGKDDLAVAPNTLNFVFNSLIGVDESYDVTIKKVDGVQQIPDNASECKVDYGKGRAVFNVTSVEVTCTLKTHALGGTISNPNGVTGDLVLLNGADSKTVTLTGLNQQPFQMNPVGEDQPYGITVLSAPDGHTCSVTSANGTGYMQKNDISSVVVTCN